MSTWTNYDQVLQQLRAFGLQVSRLEIEPPPGRLVIRCRDKDDKGKQLSGWYRLRELRTGAGELLLIGAYGTWREGRGAHKVELGGEVKKLSDHERAAIRARITEDRRAAEAVRLAIARKAAARAESAWLKHCQPDGRSAYLERKGVGAHGARFTPSGNLVIPIMDAADKIHGLQVIFGDPATVKRKGRDKDFWPPGLAKRSHFYRIGGAPDGVVIVAEGFATGASVFEATGIPVLVAFDCGNLLAVCEAARKRWPRARILIAADDDFLGRCNGCKKYTPVIEPKCRHCAADHERENPGISHASSAALTVEGAWIAPQFKDRGDRKLTDFNDLHHTEGLHAVRAQIEARLAALQWTVSARVEPHAQGGGGDEKGGFDFSLDALLRNFVLIYTTETVFDQQQRIVLNLSALRAAAGKARVRDWLEHPQRLMVNPEQIVFEPAGTPEGCYNLWGGWPTTPRSGACDNIVGLLEYLCSGEENSTAVFDWVLRWLAYPIQHPGAKMQTALLVHGPEGTGKNMFFGCVRDIYARYGGIFSQTELESQFNGYASRKLFMIGNEVVTRTEIYHQQGRLKNMITEPEWQVNEKNMPTRLEANHCNFAFFSNRLDIARLDPNDRRYCVIWTPEAAKSEMYSAVKAEIAAGGSAALHDYLLNVSLEGFGPHTPPPMTRSKGDLINQSLDSTERFWLEWERGHLPVPCTLCKVADLYRAYRHWAQLTGVFKPAPEYVLVGVLGKKPGLRKDRRRFFNGDGREHQATCIQPPKIADKPADITDIQWVTDHIKVFNNALTDWAPQK